MIQISKILHPTDFSDLSEGALRYALQFARDYEAALHVVHVVDEAYQYWMSMVPNTMPVGAPVVDDVVRTSTESLERFVADKIGDKVKSVAQVLSGNPAIEIVRYASDQAIDLIVIGTHGRGGLSHMLLGSVTEKVVRKAECPVLTVHYHGREFITP